MGGSFTADGKVKLKEKKINERIFNIFMPEDLALLKTLNIRVLVVNDSNEVVKTLELSQELEERAKLTEAGLVSVTAEDLALMKLGTQNASSRQLEIDRFQTGKSKICLFTFKAGGVGLSLHHHDATCLPRESIIAPCYSAIELVQGLGRAPRLTSMSDTVQTLIFYKGTIEEHISAKVSQKLRCLREVVRQRESWEDMICEEVNNQITPKQQLVTEVVDDSTTEEEDDNENN